ncbi:MAG TPA: SMP-30/gluconolactonase/LRE family protein [Trebonia sp.]
MIRQLSADVAVPSQCYLAEGPVWDPVAGLLRWVDINPGHVHAFDPAAGTRTRFAPAGADGAAVPRADAVPVGAIGLTISGGLVLALVDGFAFGPAAPEAAGRYPLTRVDEFRVDASAVRFNDGKPSPWGDFWAGTMPWKDDGPACALYRLTPDGRVAELFDGVGLSNGLDWSDDRGSFYYADSRSGGVDVFATDPATGELGRRRRFVTVESGLPDGLALDADGCLWLAVFGTGEVRRYTPAGELDTVIRLPVDQPTSMAFGGDDLSTLYITTAREKLTQAEVAAQPHSGDIFACAPGTVGRPPNLFTA